jgi:hypothetical protein
MPGPFRKRVGGGTVAAERKPRMPVIVRNVPSGYDWGWHSREDQRMHLQTLGKPPSCKVWLEQKGERAFQPVGKVPSKLLRPLREFLAEQRQAVEDEWVRLMLDLHWLHLHIALPKLTLVAYPNTSGRFTREIDLTTWLDEKQLASLRPEIIDLSREMAALRLWTNRPDSETYDVRLSRLLWDQAG